MEKGGGNLIEGNYLGTDSSGTVALGNFNGLFIDGSANNTVGGTLPSDRNVISGNNGSVATGADGIFFFNAGATGNVVLGNYIGTDVTGKHALGDGANGVTIFQDGGANTIGGAASSARNIISGNGAAGVLLASDAAVREVVVGNFIGTDVTGSNSLGNGAAGVLGDDNVGARIGGSGPGEGNVISGNVIGIELVGDTNDVVAGNLIGTDASGDKALGNATAGVILDTAENNLIGRTVAGSGNIISGNGEAGILVRDGAFGNAVAGNRIGTIASGTSYLPNGQMGVGIYLSNSLRLHSLARCSMLMALYNLPVT